MCVCVRACVCLCDQPELSVAFGLTETLNVETLRNLLGTIITWLGCGLVDAPLTPYNDGLGLDWLAVVSVCVYELIPLWANG